MTKQSKQPVLGYADLKSNCKTWATKTRDYIATNTKMFVEHLEALDSQYKAPVPTPNATEEQTLAYQKELKEWKKMNIQLLAIIRTGLQTEVQTSINMDDITNAIDAWKAVFTLANANNTATKRERRDDFENYLQFDGQRTIPIELFSSEFVSRAERYRDAGGHLTKSEELSQFCANLNSIHAMQGTVYKSKFKESSTESKEVAKEITELFLELRTQLSEDETRMIWFDTRRFYSDLF